MSRNNDNGSGRSARLELKLNLSPPPAAAAAAAAERMDVNGDDEGSGSSSPSSCVSSDGSPAGGKSSPMVIGACTRCLMYCMVAKEDYPTCINCKQPCLVGLLPDGDGDDSKRGKRK